LPVTKVSIADEIGVHRNTMGLEYIKIHLLAYPEFNPNIEKSRVETNEEYESVIAALTAKLENAKKSNKKLVYENSKLQLSNRELDYKYKRLLGCYQTEIGKKIIPF